MKTILEKEKKLSEAIKKLNNLKFSSSKQLRELEYLRDKKNQLEIEKNEI